MQNCDRYNQTIYPLSVEYLNILKEQLANLPERPCPNAVRQLKMRIKLVEGKLRKRNFYLNR